MLKEKKNKLILIAIAALVVVGLLLFLYCMLTYSIAIGHWEKGDHAKAAAQFSKIMLYRDSRKYVNEFKEDLTEQLTKSHWESQTFDSKYFKGYRYLTFHEDGTVTDGAYGDAKRGTGDQNYPGDPQGYKIVFKHGDVYVKTKSHEFKAVFDGDELSRFEIKVKYDGNSIRLTYDYEWGNRKGSTPVG